MDTTIFLITMALCAVALFLIMAPSKIVHKHPADRPVSHVFIDLETLGTAQDSAILVIAAYAVDGWGNKILSECWRIDPDSARAFGSVDPATEKWWSEQSDFARAQAFTARPRMALPEALRALAGMFESLESRKARVYVWGNSPSFDCAILRNAYKAAGVAIPWAFWQERDCRTVAWIGEWIGFDAKANTEFKGQRHVALDDARHQAKYTIRILNEIGGL